MTESLQQHWKGILVTLIVLLALTWIVYEQLTEPLPRDEYMWESYERDEIYAPWLRQVRAGLLGWGNVANAVPAATVNYVFMVAT